MEIGKLLQMNSVILVGNLLNSNVVLEMKLKGNGNWERIRDICLHEYKS